MSDKYTLIGTWSTTPSSGALLTSGKPAFTAPINEVVVLALKDAQDFDLTVDAPVNVSFDGVTAANVVNISTNRKVRVRLTCADGTQQAISVDGDLKLISKSVPYTAIDLTRVIGQETLVSVFLGQKA